MAISVTCGGCGKLSNVPDEHAGKRGRCKQCGDLIAIPAPELVAAFGSAATVAEADDLVSPPPRFNPEMAMEAIAESDDDEGEAWRSAFDLRSRVRSRRKQAGPREPWFYQVLVVYAYLIIGLGFAVSGVLVGSVIFVFLRNPDRELFPTLAALLVPAAIGFGSAVVGSPILLGVDIARNIRAIRLQGHPIG